MTVGTSATITLGAGDDILGATGGSTNVGGSAIIDMGTGGDTFNPSADVVIGGSLTLRGANLVDVGGNVNVILSVSVLTNTEYQPSSYSTAAGTIVGGNFSYYGSNRSDLVSLATGGDLIDGNVNVYLGTNILGGDSQLDVTAATIGGSISANAAQSPAARQ